MSCRESEGRQERRVAARVREVAERDAGRCQRGRGSLGSKSRRGKRFKEAQRACVAMRLYCCVFDGRKGGVCRRTSARCAACAMSACVAGACLGAREELEAARREDCTRSQQNLFCCRRRGVECGGPELLNSVD